jgi:hypothetical protein
MVAATKPLLQYSGKFPPLAVVAAAEIAGIEIEIKEEPKFAKDAPPLLCLPEGYLARLRSCLLVLLYSEDVETLVMHSVRKSSWRAVS